MVIVSNGFNKFHMSIAAAEAYRRGLLSTFITGAYPTPGLQRLARLAGIDRTPKFSRLLARGDEIPTNLVHALPSTELISVVRPQWSAAAFRYYGLRACQFVRQAAEQGARIYHYRSGFGLQSVRLAKRLGLFALCDHSIAHPSMVETLPDCQGKLPSTAQGPPSTAFWRTVLEDLELADAVVVNSDFVKRTFLLQGWPESQIEVIYLGVDRAFLDCIPKRTEPSEKEGPLRLMFAGGIGKRKGVDTLIDALRMVPDGWTLNVAGAFVDESSTMREFILHDARVNYLGLLSREQLARQMTKCDVFVFPSYCEGSARVVMEALAAGCFVITTPNSGSIVKTGVHGIVVPPGEAGELARAISKAMNDRTHVYEAGVRNARLIATQHLQGRYGDDLENLYGQIMKDEGDHIVDKTRRPAYDPSVLSASEELRSQTAIT
jgi:glycosyltransferase involved in cell wall biosynthesis